MNGVIHKDTAQLPPDEEAIGSMCSCMVVPCAGAEKEAVHWLCMVAATTAENAEKLHGFHTGVFKTTAKVTVFR